MVLKSRLSRRRLLGRTLAAGFAVGSLAAAFGRASLAAEARPPEAARRPTLVAFPNGIEMDPYRWLENPDDPETIAYLEAENAYLAEGMAPLADLQEELRAELLERIDIDDQSPPVPWYGWLYYTRTEQGKNYGIVCRRKDEPGAPEQVLIDLNTVDSEYVNMSGWSPTRDNRYLAFDLDLVGEEIYEISILDMESGEVVERIPRAAGFAWAGDSQTLFYGAQVDTRRTSEIRRHRFGTDVAGDATILRENQPMFSLGVATTKDFAYVVTYASAFDTNEVRFLPAADLDGELRLLQPRKPGIRVGLEHQNGNFVLVTDEDAPNNKVLVAPAGDQPPTSWETLIAHDGDRPLTGLDVFADHLVVYGRSGGFTAVWKRDSDTGDLEQFTFDDEIYTVSAGSNWMYETNKLRVNYTSPVTPDTDYEFDLDTGERTVLKRLPVPADFDASRYAARRLYAPSFDGVAVPIALVSLADGGGKPRPIRLDGYGAYGINQDPVFSLARLSLIDRGIAIATASIRGGGELGRWWWDDGRLLNKDNTFRDFIACAEYLIREGLTTSDQLAAMGGSAGGMLMGVVANWRPDLFKAIVANVPAADRIALLMRSQTGPANTNEFGDPRDPIMYEYLLSYSPYQNVRSQAYPAMLVTAGLEDTRTWYWAAAKWVARLRDRGTGEAPLFLRTTMAGGHGGASGTENFARDTAELYAFLLSQFGLAPAPAVAAAAPTAAKRDTAVVEQPVAEAVASVGQSPAATVRAVASTTRQSPVV